MGNAYNSESGVFTCPYDGLYAFYVSFYPAATQQFEGFIRHDAISGFDAIPLYAEVSNIGQNVAGRQSSNYQLIVCAPGDTVRVEVVGSDQMLFAGYPFSSFSGYMLQEFF